MTEEDRAHGVSLRSALVVWRMARGWRPTTREVAECTGLQVNSAWALMSRLAGGLPIVLGDDSRWRDITLDKPDTTN
jgi:hypothetical protein